MCHEDFRTLPARRAAKVLTIPGLCCSGPDHWQSIWETLPWHCRRIELPGWDDPDPREWVAAIDRALSGSPGPVVVAAHSLGCHAIVKWALSRPSATGRIVGALLVAPPDVDAPAADPRVARFAPMAVGVLPFPAILVASRNDPYAAFPRSRAMAAGWGAQWADLGEAGHINAASGLGAWDEGLRMIERLVREAASPVRLVS